MKIAMLLDNPFTNDRRVFREANTLTENGHHLELYCVNQHDLPELDSSNGFIVKRIFSSEIYNVKKPGILLSYADVIAAFKPDVVHCHDQLMLQLGTTLKKQNPGIILVYDSHELFSCWPLNLSSFNDKFIWLKSWIVRKYQVFLEKRNARFIDHLITVNSSIANHLKSYFQLKHQPVVLRNIPEKESFVTDKSFLRKKFNIPPDHKILVFIGSAIYLKTLNLEQVMDELGNQAGLSFIIIAGEQGGKKDVMLYAQQRNYSNIYFHDKLPPQEIGKYLASCDVGLVPTWNKTDLSYWYALDNKLFEYLMSGIPVLATQQPEYKAIIEKYNTGVCVNPDEPDAYLEGWKKIIGNYDEYQKNILPALEVLNWKNESEKLVELYNQFNVTGS